MEISDRRYQELLESIGIRQIRRDPVRFMERTARRSAPSISRHDEFKGIEYQRAAPPIARLSTAREVKEILLVDTETDRLRAVQSVLRLEADVAACSDFGVARALLLARPPDLLVTNLRLHAYNGLHLVHLTAGTLTRCVVYGTDDDGFLAQEVRSAGAFYERAERLPQALSAYVHALLPPQDRRDPVVLDRRQIFRGGRRCTDLRCEDL